MQPEFGVIAAVNPSHTSEGLIIGWLISENTLAAFPSDFDLALANPCRMMRRLLEKLNFLLVVPVK